MELSTPHTDQPLLLGLAVFQNADKLEYVRSFHIYKKGGYWHTIQQEFLSKGRALTEMGALTHLACCCGGGKNDVQDYMKLITAKQERDGWKCLLDFCTTPPRSPPPLTAAAMLVASAWSSANALFINANNGHESFPVDWERPQCILPSLCACLKGHESAKEINVKHVESTETTSQRLQLDLWQEWGSDLELASPRLSKTFELPLLKNHSSEANTAMYGAISSPMSNSNVDSLPWMQTHLGQNPLKMLTVMAGPQLNEGMGMNVIGVACTFMSPDSNFETNLGESSTHCNILANMLPLDLNQMAFMNLENAVDMHDNLMNGRSDHIPFDSGMSQPMSSTSNTCSSSDERSLEAENSEVQDRLKELECGVSNGIQNQREPSNKSSSSRPGRLSELTKDELTHYFNMPITQASKELKVGLTVLKKRCRIFGIPRWPHRKMKSINGLIRNIQDLVKGDGDDKDVNRVQFAVEELEKQKKEMQECPGIQLPERTKRLRQACFKASYRKRRQALNDPSADTHYKAPASNSNGGSSNNSSSSNSFYYPYCE